MASLRTTIIGANGLRKASSGNHDVLVQMKMLQSADLPQQMVRTSTRGQSTNPVWNEKLTLDVYEEDAELEVLIWDKFVGKEFLGMVHVLLADLECNVAQTFELPIEDDPSKSSSDGKCTGTLTLELYFNFPQHVYLRTPEMRVAQSARSHTSLRNPAGIGLVLGQATNEALYVTAMNPGGPAAQSQQVHVKDCLRAVDGTNVYKQPIESAQKLIQGEHGAFLTLTLTRRVRDDEGSYRHADVVVTIPRLLALPSGSTISPAAPETAQIADASAQGWPIGADNNMSGIPHSADRSDFITPPNPDRPHSQSSKSRNSRGGDRDMGDKGGRGDKDRDRDRDSRRGDRGSRGDRPRSSDRGGGRGDSSSRSRSRSQSRPESSRVDSGRTGTDIVSLDSERFNERGERHRSSERAGADQKRHSSSRSRDRRDLRGDSDGGYADDLRHDNDNDVDVDGSAPIKHSGVGLFFKHDNDGNIVVANVVKGYSAHHSGAVRIKDILLSIDSTPIPPHTDHLRVRQLAMGVSGTMVSMTLQRPAVTNQDGDVEVEAIAYTVDLMRGSSEFLENYRIEIRRRELLGELEELKSLRRTEQRGRLREEDTRKRIAMAIEEEGRLCRELEGKQAMLMRELQRARDDCVHKRSECEEEQRKLRVLSESVEDTLMEEMRRQQLAKGQLDTFNSRRCCM